MERGWEASGMADPDDASQPYGSSMGGATERDVSDIAARGAARAHPRYRRPGAPLAPCCGRVLPTSPKRDDVHILQIAPLWEDVPPPAYGGTEAVVSLLTETLVLRRVTTSPSPPPAVPRRAHASSVPYGRSLRPPTISTTAIPTTGRTRDGVGARAQLRPHHNHAGELAMAMSRLIRRPGAHDDALSQHAGHEIRLGPVRGAYNTISRAQHGAMLPVHGPARFMGHVYNAIDVDTFPYQAKKGDELLFLSRIAPEKGAHQAVAVAKAAGRRLILAGKIDRFNRAYSKKSCAPSSTAQSSFSARRTPRRSANCSRTPTAPPAARLGGAVRARHARVNGLRHAGDRAAPRQRARTHRPRRDRISSWIRSPKWPRPSPTSHA